MIKTTQEAHEFLEKHLKFMTPMWKLAPEGEKYLEEFKSAIKVIKTPHIGEKRIWNDTVIECRFLTKTGNQRKFRLQHNYEKIYTRSNTIKLEDIPMTDQIKQDVINRIHNSIKLEF